MSVGLERGNAVAVNVSLAPDLIRVLQSFDKPLDESVRELIVLELYRQGRISSGKAGELLSLPRITFIQYASSLGIPFFDMTEQELQSDLDNAGNARDRRRLQQ
jgi:predicted HTH domain antitoxin